MNNFDPANRDYSAWLGLCPVYVWFHITGFVLSEREGVPEWWFVWNLRVCNWITKVFGVRVMPWGFTYIGGAHRAHDPQ